MDQVTTLLYNAFVSEDKEFATAFREESGRMGLQSMLDDPLWLIKEHWEKGKSLRQIAREAGVPLRKVQRRFEKYGLPTRPHAIAMAMAARERAKRQAQQVQYRNKEWLKEMYLKRNMTIAEIARKCGVKSDTIREWIKRYGLKKEKTPPPWHDREWLYHQYVVLGKTAPQIAKEVGCARPTITAALWKFGIRKTAPQE